MIISYDNFTDHLRKFGVRVAFLPGFLIFADENFAIDKRSARVETRLMMLKTNPSQRRTCDTAFWTHVLQEPLPLPNWKG